MDWLEISRAVVLLLGGSISITLFTLSVKLFTVDSADYNKNRDCYRNFMDPLRGTVLVHSEGSLNRRVQPGLAINKNNEWVAQGRLSDEALDAVLR